MNPNCQYRFLLATIFLKRAYKVSNFFSRSNHVENVSTADVALEKSVITHYIDYIQARISPTGEDDRGTDSFPAFDRRESTSIMNV